MKGKIMFGVVIYKKEKEENAKKILQKHLVEIKLKNGVMFSHGREKDGWVLEQIPSNAFLTYNHFDAFLYGLSADLSKSGIGMVLGHNDEEGFFWMDYPTYETIKPFEAVILGAEEIRYFECDKCHAIIKENDETDKYVRMRIQPKECYENQGGCGRISTFSEVKKEWVKKNHPEILK